MSLFAELKRRKVFKVGAAYVVIAWIVVQVASIALPAFEAPPWVLRVFILVLMLGFPIALVMAWVFDVTPEGVRAETGRRGNTLVFIVAAALTALALGWYFKGQPSYRKDEERGSESLSGPGTVAKAESAGAESDSDPLSPSVAVLPFANMSGTPEQEYFSDGMTEELLNVLARVPNLKVAARTSVFQFKDKGGDVREIGAKLGVSHIVEGSVRRDGEKVRVTAQLIRVADGFHVWSQSYDRELKSVFALQDEIARQVAEQLVTSLGGAGPAAARGNVDPLAYDDYLKGRALYRARRSLLRAILHFEAAVERAPEFATAWANLSLAYDVSAYGTTAAQQLALGNRLAHMRTAAERAAALAPTAATTLHALANVARGQGRFLDAERAYLASIAQDDTYPDVREDLSEFLSAMGRPEDALVAARELVALEPYNKLFWYRIAQVGILLDRADLIDEAVPRMLDLDPVYFFGATARYRREYANGRIDSAREELAKAYAVNPDVAAAEWGLFRWSQGDPGIDIDDAFVEQMITGSYGWDYPQYAAMRGNADLYFRSLGSPYNSDKRFYLYSYLEAAIAAPYLADPRAKALLRESGFEAYWREKGWPALCRPLGDADFVCAPAAKRAAKS